MKPKDYRDIVEEKIQKGEYKKIDINKAIGCTARNISYLFEESIDRLDKCIAE